MRDPSHVRHSSRLRDQLALVGRSARLRRLCSAQMKGVGVLLLLLLASGLTLLQAGKPPYFLTPKSNASSLSGGAACSYAALCRPTVVLVSWLRQSPSHDVSGFTFHSLRNGALESVLVVASWQLVQRLETAVLVCFPSTVGATKVKTPRRQATVEAVEVRGELPFVMSE